GPAAAAVAGVGRHRAALPFAFLHAVGRAEPAVIVPLDHAREPATLGRADDIDQLGFAENLGDTQELADFMFRRRRQAKFADEALRFAVRFWQQRHARGLPGL